MAHIGPHHRRRGPAPGGALNIELNPCSGGMARGFQLAGIEFDLAVDFDPNAIESYERNIGHRPVCMDIRDLLRMVRMGWSPGPVELLVADPPCTPWSHGGKGRGLDDERDLLPQTAELVELLRPRSWFIGNVPGLDDARNWVRVVQPIIGGMAKRAGYCVDYGVFDCADYGVPQHRVRPFWFGHLEGTPCIRWPEPTHGDWSTMRLDGRLPWVTCGQALSERFGPNPSAWGRHVRLRHRRGKDAGKKPRASESGHPAGVVTTKPNQGDGTVVRVSEKHPAAQADEPAHTLRGGGSWHSAPQTVLALNDRHPPSSVDAPSHTISAGMPQQRISHAQSPPAAHAQPCGQALQCRDDQSRRWQQGGTRSRNGDLRPVSPAPPTLSNKWGPATAGSSCPRKRAPVCRVSPRTGASPARRRRRATRRLAKRCRRRWLRRSRGPMWIGCTTARRHPNPLHEVRTMSDNKQPEIRDTVRVDLSADRIEDLRERMGKMLTDLEDIGDLMGRESFMWLSLVAEALNVGENHDEIEGVARACIRRIDELDTALYDFHVYFDPKGGMSQVPRGPFDRSRDLVERGDQ